MSAPHIVILGSGFAALTTVRELRRREEKYRGDRPELDLERIHQGAVGGLELRSVGLE